MLKLLVLTLSFIYEHFTFLKEHFPLFFRLFQLFLDFHVFMIVLKLDKTLLAIIFRSLILALALEANIELSDSRMCWASKIVILCPTIKKSRLELLTLHKRFFLLKISL